MAVHHLGRGGTPPPKPKGPSWGKTTLTIGKIWLGHFGAQIFGSPTKKPNCVFLPACLPACLPD